ncbi:MAG: hypothetical protein V7640_2253 [Betaproteobacteria bacterium]
MSDLSDLLELPGAAIETEEDFDAIDGCGSSAGGRWVCDRATDSGARRVHVIARGTSRSQRSRLAMEKQRR